MTHSVTSYSSTKIKFSVTTSCRPKSSSSHLFILRVVSSETMLLLLSSGTLFFSDDGVYKTINIRYKVYVMVYFTSVLLLDYFRKIKANI